LLNTKFIFFTSPASFEGKGIAMLRDASSHKRLQFMLILIIGCCIATISFASNSTLKSSPNEKSLIFDENISQVEYQQSETANIEASNDHAGKSVRVDEQKLLRVTLLLARYKQAYEETRQKLQNAMDINDDLIKAFKLQEQIIEEMKAKMNSMKQEVIQLKSKKADTSVPAPPLVKNSSPTA